MYSFLSYLLIYFFLPDCHSHSVGPSVFYNDVSWHGSAVALSFIKSFTPHIGVSIQKLGFSYS